MTTIRAAVATDATAIAHLLDQLGHSTIPEAIPARVATLEREGGIVLVAVDDDQRLTGVASGSRLTTLHVDGQVAYITALVADAAARRQGVGRALVAELERWAKACGCSRLSVTSAERRADAHAFYPSCGLPYTGRRFAKSLTAPTP